MSKKKKATKNNKVKLGVKRRLSLYYTRFLLAVKIFIVCSTIILLFTNFFQVQKQKIFNILVDITSDAGFILEHVIIEGQRNVTENNIIESIGADYGESIYSLSIDDIRKRIEENPWVKVALVERRLPNTLHVAIIERTPIAIWQFKQKIYIIDKEGNRITSKDIEKFSDLIHVVGQDANVYALGLIEELARHPALSKKVISAVRYGQRRWDLNLEQKINVKMPDKAFSEAYEYLHALDKKGKLFNQNYKVINLKDSNKYYIEKW
ncbi:MAG: cell division protein FtsQ/DivIB [Rickettsiaceae bacterium]